MKVVITRARSQSDPFGQALVEGGFEPVYFPVIEIRPAEDRSELAEAIRNIGSYDWVIFTSVNAVDIFFEHSSSWNAAGHSVRTVPPSGVPAGPRIAAIGRKTAEALRAHGAQADFVPDEFVAEAILPGLGNVKDLRILMPRAEIARDVLPRAIRQAGGMAHEITIYRTLPAAPDANGLAALKAGVEVIALTSASTAQNFTAIARAQGLDPAHLPGEPVFACIGPVTERAARDEGITRIIVAHEHTTDGLVDIIGQYARNLEIL